MLYQHLANILDTRQRWIQVFRDRATAASQPLAIEGNNALVRLCEKDVDELEWAQQQLAELIGGLEDA